MKYKPFLLWLLFVTLISIATLYAAYWRDLFGIISRIDVTKITFLISFLFSMFSILIGFQIFKLCKYGQNKFDVVFIMNWSDRLLDLGMIGTVCGLFYFLTHATIGGDNTQVITRAMGTSFGTTAAGLICKFLLDLQIDGLLKHKSMSCSLDENQEK